MPREIDEDLIEATIRRVAEKKAAELAAPPIEMPVAEAVAPEFGSRADPPDEVQATPQPEPVGDPPAVSSAGTTPRAEDGEGEDPVAVILARIDQLSAQIGDLHGQVAQIATALGPLTAPSRVGSTPYASPNVVAMASRQAPPPASRASTAEQLEPVIDKRPIPKPLPPLEIEPRRGLDLLPRNYRITVEDKRRGVDLVPLHRALLSMEGVRDMALLSYNNGVAIVSLEMIGDLDPDALAQSVSEVMSREARTEVHNELTMVVKLAED